MTQEQEGKWKRFRKTEEAAFLRHLFIALSNKKSSFEKCILIFFFQLSPILRKIFVTLNQTLEMKTG